MELQFILLTSLILCFNPAVVLGGAQDPRRETESEDSENALLNNIRNDSPSGLVELLNSIRYTLAALNATLAAQDIEFNALKGKVGRLSEKTNLLLTKAYPNLNLWESIDGLIQTQAKEIQTGKSFNGSTLSNITAESEQVGYEGRHTTIVFVNHLDEAIEDFTIYDHNNTTLNPAPNSVPRRTQEVFTFAHPSKANYVLTSFSYVIPETDVRIGAISWGGAFGAGLAFLPKMTDMKSYYDSQKGIEGSSVYEWGDHVDRNLSVGYKNYYARMFADSDGKYKATLRIELIKFPLDD